MMIILLVLILGFVVAGFMIISQHKLLRSSDRFLKDHQSFLCILDLVFVIPNLHSNTDWSLPRIYLHWLKFALLLLDMIFLAWRTKLDWSLLRLV